MHSCPLQDLTGIHAEESGAIIQSLVGKKQPKNVSICADLIVVEFVNSDVPCYQ